MTRRKRKLLLISIIFILALAVVYYVVSRYYRRLDDSDLMPSRANITEAENGFKCIDFAEGDIYLPSDNAERDRYRLLEEWALWDEILVEKANAHNKIPLQKLDEALAKPHFQVPEIRNCDTLINYTSHWRPLARYMSIRARQLQKQGQDQEAFETALKIVRFGHMVENSDGVIIHVLVGEAIESIGLTTIKRLLDETTLNSRDLKRFSGELPGMEPTLPPLVQAFKWEYVTTCNSLDDMAAGNLNPVWKETFGGRFLRPGYFYNPRATKRLLAQAYRETIKYVEADKAHRNDAELEKLKTSCKAASRFSPNSAGRRLVPDLLMNQYRILERICEVQYENRVVRLLIALKCYKLDHGDLPDSLDQLVPEYIESVPLDPYDEKPLRYSKDRRIMWSVGTDLVDDGGYTPPESVGPDTPGPIILYRSKFTDPTTEIEF